MNSIPRFIFPAPTKQQTSTAIKEALTDDLPPVVTNIISEYAHENIDYGLVNRSLEFDSDGNVTNPEVRATYKAVLRSPFVPAALKSQLCATISHVESWSPSTTIKRYHQELENISEEIIADGDRIELPSVEISRITLTLNLRGANLRGAIIRQAEIHSNMSYADLTGTQFIKVGFRFARMTHAVTTGMKMTGCNFRSTEVTGTLLTDPKLLKLIFKGTHERIREDCRPGISLDRLQETNLFLSGGFSGDDNLDLDEDDSNHSSTETCVIL